MEGDGGAGWAAEVSAAEALIDRAKGAIMIVKLKNPSYIIISS